jgi:predicted transglutaminase-like cysteine proteinase
VRRSGIILFLALVAVTASVAPGAAQSGHFLSTVGSGRSPVGFTEACADYTWLCAAPKSSAYMTDVELKKAAQSVNAHVNLTVAPRPSAASKWSLPSEAGGDCVGYALLKLRLLLSAGVPAQRLFISTVLTASGEDHAVLILRTREQDLVLDNLRPAIVAWNETGYTFVKMQNPSARSVWELVLIGPRASRS